jgi:hypothetical protein
MNKSAEAYPLFERHMGVWQGTHRVLSATGGILDAFEARVVCQRSRDRYSQTTTRSWPDGRQATSQFSGRFSDGRLLYESARVVGSGIEVDERNILTRWHDPQTAHVEWCGLISLLGDDRRCRTIQHLESGRLVGVTVIEERKVG